MNFKERCAVIRAMETLARCINDEEIFAIWLTEGVADGDITDGTPDDDLECYCDDKIYAELMDTFLFVMAKAKRSGGLYSDRVLSLSDE